MPVFNEEAFKTMERFYRANLISGLTGCKPAMLVGTVSPEGIPNLALFQNVVHLGADPALVGLINRPREATPHTLANAESSGWLTLNSVHASFLSAAHQTSAKFDAGVNEFTAVGLDSVYEKDIPAPFVQQSEVQIALSLVEIVPVRHNRTFLIIGKVVFCRLPDELLQPDGFVDYRGSTIAGSIGLDSYFVPQPVVRFPYAKPDKPVVPMEGYSK